MANIIPLYWKWISSSCWCQEHHAPAFYSPLLGPSPPWVSSQLQTTSDFGICASHLTCQQFKVTATKISTKLFVHRFIFCSFASVKRPGWYTAVPGKLTHCKKKAVLCRAVSAVHITPAQQRLHMDGRKSMKCQTQLQHVRHMLPDVIQY